MKASTKKIDLNPDETSALIERVKSRSLQEKDYEILLSIIEMVLYLYRVVSEKHHSILRLLRMVFGVKTESSKNILKEAREKASQEDKPDDAPSAEDAPAVKDIQKKKGHGRNGAASYPRACRIGISHECFKAGDPCPLCPKGKLYPLTPPAVVVRMKGHAPVEPTIFDLERLRCNLCGEVFTASLPDGVGEEKYDETARAIIACLKYGSGFPFYRLEGLQKNMEAPLPTSTQWDETEKLADTVHPVYPELIREAAQGEILHNDDTSMRILSLAREIAQEDAERKGIFTTGVVSISGGNKIALFFTGNRHAGENLGEILKQRAADLDVPLQMCDALAQNEPETSETIISNCLFHARRNFVDVYSSFPDECGHIIKAIGKLYHFDSIAKERNLSSQERLEFHQTHSGPVMDELKRWLTDQLDQKKVEPNSGLGKAIQYMLKRWERFTLFLHIPNAPLDNDICEQTLKRAVLHRKNCMFYKTEHGAYIGDMFMSLIHTCSLCGANPFHYFVTLQKHAAEVRKNPRMWLPWNYQERIHSPPS